MSKQHRKQRLPRGAQARAAERKALRRACLFGAALLAAACDTGACPRGFARKLDQCVRLTAPCGDAGACECALQCDGGRALVRSFGDLDRSPGYMEEVQNGGTGLQIDAAGNVYLSGTFSRVTSFGADVSLRSRGLSDGFVAKFDAQLEPLWARATMQTPALESARHLVVDSSGAVWVLSVRRPDLPSFPTRAPHLLLLQKWSPDGELLVAHELELRTDAWFIGGKQLTLDADDNVYLGLGAQGELSLLGRSGPSGPPSATDALLVKLSAAGELIWMQRYGGSGTVSPIGLQTVEIAGEQRLVLFGSYLGTLDRNVPPAPPSSLPADAFLLLIDLDGQVLARVTYGGETADEAEGFTSVVVRADGTFDIAGVSLGRVDRVESSDGFIVTYRDLDSAPIAQRFGGPGADGWVDMTEIDHGRYALVGVISPGSEAAEGERSDTRDLHLATYERGEQGLSLISRRVIGGPGPDMGAAVVWSAASRQLYVTGLIDGELTLDGSPVGRAESHSILLWRMDL